MQRLICDLYRRCEMVVVVVSVMEDVFVNPWQWGDAELVPGPLVTRLPLKLDSSYIHKPPSNLCHTINTCLLGHTPAWSKDDGVTGIATDGTSRCNYPSVFLGLLISMAVHPYRARPAQKRRHLPL